MYATEKIFSDTDIDAIESLPLTAYHRAVDMEVVKADTDGSYFQFLCHAYLASPINQLQT
jgi:hypothetical protein